MCRVISCQVASCRGNHGVTCACLYLAADQAAAVHDQQAEDGPSDGDVPLVGATCLGPLTPEDATMVLTPKSAIASDPLDTALTIYRVRLSFWPARWPFMPALFLPLSDSHCMQCS